MAIQVLPYYLTLMSLVALKLLQLPSEKELPFSSTLVLIQYEHNHNCPYE